MLIVTPGLNAFRRAVSDQKLTGKEARQLLKYRDELKPELKRIRKGATVVVGHKQGGRPIFGHVTMIGDAKTVLDGAFPAKK